MIIIDLELCVGCGHCVPFCPADALNVYGTVKIDYALCTECQTCIDYCPNQAFGWNAV